MGIAVGNLFFMTCPSCRSEDLYRSRGRGIYERIISRALGRYPYDCNQCGARFY